MDVNPGPMNPDLLFLAAEHRARKLFLEPETGSDCTLNFRRGDQLFWRWYKTVGEQMQLVRPFIDLAGFGGVVDCGSRSVDRALIEALVERWRPETHTFHLPFGEATVTLQDVNVLFGLPVEGGVISGSDITLTTQQRVIRCHNLLGFVPLEDSFKGNFLKLSTILTHIQQNPLAQQGVADETLQQRARCIILILCGGAIFSDTNNNYVSLHFLNHLENLQECGLLSWGSAALACLYKNLCKATKPETRDIGGPLHLLQTWAWTRIRSLAPVQQAPQNLQLPYGAL